MRSMPILFCLAACSLEPFAPFELEGGEAPYSDPSAEPNEASEVESLNAPRWAFDEAERRYDVPADLLIAMSVNGTGHQMVEGEQEFDGQVPTFGVMSLPDTLVDYAAGLAGVSSHDAVFDRKANIYAAAALLSEWADEQQLDRGDTNAWAPVVAKYSFIERDVGQSTFIHQRVYERLRLGVNMEGLQVAPRKVNPDFPVVHEPDYAAGADRTYAKWRPSPNTSTRPSGTAGKPAMVIVHTCEGSYSGCWSWLTNSRSGVSAHYVIDPTGNEVSQLVREDRAAWHIGASYQCSRNGSTDCWRNGTSSNRFTIGIEHAGYAKQASWHEGLLDTSSELVCDITKTHGIPRDSYHIVGHGRLQPYNRIDPGPNWPWDDYLADVRTKCGADGSEEPEEREEDSGTPAGTRVIDSNNARNDSENQYIKVSGNWKASANVGGYYESGYWWRTTGSSADSADFWFRNDAKTCYRVAAWWPAAIDRSKRAPFVMVDADNNVIDAVYVDQSSSHARWVDMGAFQFTSGWNRVALSRWTDPGRVVVADAVRLTPSTDCAGPSKDPVDIVVDSHSDENGPNARVEFSSAWTASTATSGYHGTDYVWAETERVSDPFKHWFYLEDPTKVTVKARWTAGSNRSTKAPFLVWNASNSLVDTVTVDQSKQHNTWVGLGTWTLPAGWNRVELSRWTTEGKVVVADAIRVSSAE